MIIQVDSLHRHRHPEDDRLEWGREVLVDHREPPGRPLRFVAAVDRRLLDHLGERGRADAERPLLPGSLVPVTLARATFFIYPAPWWPPPSGSGCLPGGNLLRRLVTPLCSAAGNQMDLKLEAQGGGGALQGIERGPRLRRIEQSINRRATGLHTSRHF